MSEYIERGALLEVLGRNSIIDKITYADGKTIREKIVDFPAADVVKVKHGRWERIGENYENCTNCGTIFEALPTQYVFEENNKYCRNCGCKMDGGKENV